jgi:heme/copper-type cytochrome/quinol oxidase subunit 2
MGFGVLSLYGLWAAYGAAPTSLDFVSAGDGAGHAGMGHGAGSAMSPEHFRKLAEEFIEANSLPDGSVKPRYPDKHAGPAHDAHTDEEVGHGHTDEHVEPVHGAHADEDEDHGRSDDPAAPPRMAMAEAHEHEGEAAPVHRSQTEYEPLDVYLMATRYGYEPDLLRLDTHVPYRFRIMAVDADHGSSILVRMAGHMIRCRAKTLTQKTLMFTAPGEYLVYCTVYCGEGHDLMMGKIVVA